MGNKMFIYTNMCNTLQTTDRSKISQSNEKAKIALRLKLEHLDSFETIGPKPFLGTRRSWVAFFFWEREILLAEKK